MTKRVEIDLIDEEEEMAEFFTMMEEAMRGPKFKFVRAGKGEPVEEPVKVYRIEMPNGNGPYNSGFDNAREIYEAICKEEEGFNCAHNAFLNKEKMGVTEKEFYKTHGEAFYACDSLQSLQDWFPLEARKYLAGYQAAVVEYEVPKGAPLAKVGRGEVIFAKGKARKVETLPVTLEGVS